jgi:hypothetical protein
LNKLEEHGFTEGAAGTSSGLRLLFFRRGKRT